MAEQLTITHIKTRRDFLKARNGSRAARDSLIVEACPSPAVKTASTDSDNVRVGFTCTKRIGNAVRRNRTKRRLRAAARDVLSRTGKPGMDYVIIGRAGTADMPFEKLVTDLEGAIKRVNDPSKARSKHRPRKR